MFHNTGKHRTPAFTLVSREKFFDDVFWYSGGTDPYISTRIYMRRIIIEGKQSILLSKFGSMNNMQLVCATIISLLENTSHPSETRHNIFVDLQFLAGSSPPMQENSGAPAKGSVELLYASRTLRAADQTQEVTRNPVMLPHVTTSSRNSTPTGLMDLSR